MSQPLHFGKELTRFPDSSSRPVSWKRGPAVQTLRGAADHYPTGRALHLDLEITGAPNFRAPNEEGLNVYGCAQPTEAGLRSILTLLGCQPVRMVCKQSRRQSSMLGQRPSLASWQLERAASGPAAQAAQAQADGDDTVEEQGQAVWFSTREETLSK